MRQRRQTFIIIVILGLMIAGCGVPSVSAGQLQAGEYQVKAAFLYNFINFIEWPRQSLLESSSTITLCIIGEDPFGDALNNFQDEIVRGKKLAIKHRSSDDLRGCDILFLPASEKHHAAKIVRSVGKSDVLTVSDSEESAGQGIIISFFVEHQKVRFIVNIDAARRAGLKISAKMLRLAKIAPSTSDKDNSE